MYSAIPMCVAHLPDHFPPEVEEEEIENFPNCKLQLCCHGYNVAVESEDVNQ